MMKKLVKSMLKAVKDSWSEVNEMMYGSYSGRIDYQKVIRMKEFWERVSYRFLNNWLLYDSFANIDVNELKEHRQNHSGNEKS